MDRRVSRSGGRMVFLAAVFTLVLATVGLTSLPSIAQPETQGPTATTNPELSTLPPQPTATLVEGQQTPVPAETSTPDPSPTATATAVPTAISTLPPIQTPPIPGEPSPRPTIAIPTIPVIRTVPPVRTIPPIRTPAVPIRTPSIPIRTIPPLRTVTPAPTATPTPTPGTLTIYAHLCDNQGFGTYGMTSLAAMKAECALDSAPITFTLTNATAGFTATVTTSGGVVTTSVPPPSVQFAMSPVPGYDLPMYSCSNDPFNKDRPNSVAHYSGTTIAPGETVVCDWFNILVSDDINLGFVMVQRCDPKPGLTDPATMPTEAELSAAGCEFYPKVAGLTLTLQVGGVAPGTTITPAIDSAGMVRGEFVDLPMDTYTVTIGVPPGISHAYIVSCSGGFGGPSGTTVAVAGGGLTFAMTPSAAGETYTCSVVLVMK